jgi:hypothetical protein
MTGSVRGALSNERPYRDRVHPNTQRDHDRARRAHAGGRTAWANRVEPCAYGGAGERDLPTLQAHADTLTAAKAANSVPAG